jgi:hypothetical protein
MLLAITTTHSPATDLGYLLRKNPARPQSFDLSFGRAHVFYPEASGERCTVALLVEVDPVNRVAERFGYNVRFLPVGPEDLAVGSPTQIGVVALTDPPNWFACPPSPTGTGMPRPYHCRLRKSGETPVPVPCPPACHAPRR